jgi:uncharacterized protein (DUF427 family)
MTRAIWKNTIIAESERVQKVDGYTYFPPESVRRDHLRNTETTSVCRWKGTASYYDVVVGEHVNVDAAWCYPHTSEAARAIQSWIGFWRGVKIERVEDEALPLSP